MKSKKKNIKSILFMMVLIIFLFAPLHMTEARFSDTAAQTADLQLKLGNVNLGFSAPNQEPVEYKNIKRTDAALTIQLPELTNKGSLSGKLYYKVELFKANEGKEPVLIQNPKEQKVALAVQWQGSEQQINSSEMNQYQLLMKNTNETMVFSPSDFLSLAFKFIPNHSEDIDSYIVKFTFLMTQEDGTAQQPLFHDVEEITYQLKMEKSHQDSFWNNLPVSEVKDLGYKYALDIPQPFQFIRSSMNVNGVRGYHESVNSATLYLESENMIDTNNWKKVVDFSQPDSDMVFSRIEKVTNKRVKITFKLKKEISFKSELWDARDYKKNSKIILMNRSARRSIQLPYHAVRKTRRESSRTVEKESVANEPIAKEKSSSSVNSSLDIVEESESSETEVTDDLMTGNEKSHATLEQLNETDFKYLDFKLDGKNQRVGMIREQADWLAQYQTVEDFAAQITAETPDIYLKYDQVIEVENIEEFANELIQQKSFHFTIELTNYPKEKILKITFTK